MFVLKQHDLTRALPLGHLKICKMNHNEEDIRLISPEVCRLDGAAPVQDPTRSSASIDDKLAH